MKSNLLKTAITLAFMVSAVFSLPTGVTMKKFYDHSKVSFIKDRVKTIWMGEVPGLPQHFWVLGQYGYIYTLYPTAGTYDHTSMVPNTSLDYTKTRITDFHEKVHPHIGSEYGSWNISFHPNFKENGKFYIIYMGKKPGQADFGTKSGGLVTLDEWQAYGEKHDSVKVVRTMLTYDHHASYGVCCMIFGPDGYLYISSCDYGSNSQDLTHMGRKILRIDVDKKDDGKEYGIPSDNPLVNETDPNIKKEIWAWGIRNIWGMHFDDITGDLWTGEIGQLQWEELNLVKKGSNGGWFDMGDGEASQHGQGFSGPCKATGNSTTISTTAFDCTKYAQPFWAFPRNASVVAGEISDNANYIPISSIAGGKNFMGAKDSPFYGYHIFFDTEDSQFWATKPDQPATFMWGTAGSLGRAKWIWYPEGDPVTDAPAATRYFRITFDVPEGKTVSAANLVLTADNSFIAYVNYNQAGSNADWSSVNIYDVTSSVTTGSNVIAISVTNETVGAAGLIGALNITYSDDSKDSHVTGTSWKAGNTFTSGWQAKDFNDGSWASSKILGDNGMDPWGSFASEKVTISGTPPSLIGQAPDSLDTGRDRNNAGQNGDGHNGVVFMDRDTFGYLYAIFVCWEAGKKYHEIYRLDHPDMKPAIAGCTDSTRAGYNAMAGISDPSQCGTPIKPIAQLQAEAKSKVFANIQSIGQVTVPKNAIGVELYDLQGKMVWRYTSSRVYEPTAIRVPVNLKTGILQVRPLY
ncbi:MAG: PQQ-dependent sugar dehydrogenase [Fibrobacteria bacterium]|nr:PQQ-dependent sugar dehydrogenase [Fibrobacteria bacterium]